VLLPVPALVPWAQVPVPVLVPLAQVVLV